jgi:hypothetical protein
VSITADLNNAPMYKARGAPPRPIDEGPPRHRWRGPLILVGFMVAWLFVVMSLSGFSGLGAGTGGTSQPPQSLGQGVTVTPADGWVSAQNVWNVGPGAVSLQRAGALVAFAADAYGGTTQQLLDDQLSSVKQQFGSFRSLPPASTSLGSNVPALKVLFSGTSNSSNLEGELVAASTGRTGVVMMAVAPAGQIARVQRDLDYMLASLVIPR